MPVIKEVTYRIICDNQECEEEYGWILFDGKRDAVRTARDDGWGYNRKSGEIFCPEHNDFDNG